MIWPDGSEFKGEWRNDQRFFGEMRMVDLTTYTGPFRNEKFHGKGKLVFLHDRIVFQGVFDQGKGHKFGKMTYPTGEVYVGEMR